MENYSFPDRVKLSITKSVKLCVSATLVLSLGYIILVLILLTPRSLFPTPSPISSSQVSSSGILIFLGMMMFMLGVIPSVILGVFGGVIFGFIMAFFRNKLPNIVAAVVGLLIGTILILIANYTFWRIAYFDSPSNVAFIEYLIPINTDSFSTYALFQNWYFFPNIIALLVSPYIGWRINKETPKLSSQQVAIY